MLSPVSVARSQEAEKQGPVVVYEEDYSKPFTVSRTWDPAKSNIYDNTGYAGVHPKYSTVVDGAAAGGKAVQIDVPGFLHTFLCNVKAVAGRTYGIKLRLRSLGQQTVEVRVRRKPAPYRAYWGTSIKTGEAWREYDLLGHVPKVYKGTEDAAAGLLLVVRATTTLWIDRVRMVELPADYAPPPDLEPEPGNVLHNSSFELDLDGWYYHSSVEIAAGAGHSGGVALRLGWWQRLSSTWYRLARGRPYRVSARCRFTGKGGRVRYGVSRYVWPSGGTTVTRDANVKGDDWQRVSFDFTVPDALRAPEPYFYFRLSAIPKERDASLLLDDVMVCPIATGEDYLPRRDVEIRARSREPRGVHVPGQDVQVDVHIWNPGKVRLPPTVEVVVFDEAGREARRQRVDLKEGLKATCTLAGLPTGYWRVETRSGLPGRVRAEGETFVVMAPPLPDVPAADAFLGSHMSNDAAALRAARLLGVRWDRFHDIMGTPTKWVTLEPEEGAWRTDEPVQVTLRRESGTQMLGLIDRCPDWAQGRHAKDRRGRTKHFHAMALREEDLPKWRTYVRRTVTQFRDHIHAWEITNEPQHSARRSLPAGTPGQQYAMIAKAAVEEIRQADPTARIIGVGGTNTHHTDFLSSLGEAGVFSLFDIISIHSYGTGAAPCGLSPASYLRCVDGVRALVRKYTGSDIEVWDTESAIPLDSASRKYRTLPAQEAYSGAVLFAKMLVARKAAGLRKWFLFHAKIQPDSYARGCGHYFELNDTVTPAALTLAVAVHFLETAEFGKLEDDPDAGLVRVHFRRPKGRVSVMWSNKGTQRVPLPEGASAFSVWGRPLRAEQGQIRLDTNPAYMVR